MMSELARETRRRLCFGQGLKMLTRNIASEYGSFNIQCNGLGPGYIETPQTAPPAPRITLTINHHFQNSATLGQDGRPGRTCSFPGLPGASDFVNGHILYVDGGILAHRKTALNYKGGCKIIIMNGPE